MKYRFHEIDILRGVACLSVVAFHYLSRGQSAGWITAHADSTVEAVAKYGYLGVHLFFMISGFVIFMSAQGATCQSFLASRVSRLYPALWASASLTAIVLSIFTHPAFTVSPVQWAVNLTMIPQWFNIDFVDGAYWSLAVELQFYLLVAAVIILRWIEHAERLVAAWLMIAALNAVRPMYPLEFWLAAKWAPLFCAGILFYRMKMKGSDAIKLSLLAVSYLLTLIELVGPQLRNAVNDSIKQATMTIGIITLFYLFFFWIISDFRKITESKYSAWIGLMTYPIYLLHQNIGYALLEKMDNYRVPFEMAVLMTIVVVVTLAWMVIMFVERPLAPRLRTLINPQPQHQ